MNLCSFSFKRAKQRWTQSICALLFIAKLVQVHCHGDDVKTNDNKNIIRHGFTNTTKDVLHRFLLIWGRHNKHALNHTVKCIAKSTPKEFPPDFFTEAQRKHGGIFLYLVIATYACIALSIVCEYYFVPSLEVICHHLHIQEDIGGATLMSIGSSAPDIVSSFMAILFVDGSLGVVTVMSTTVFNLLLIIGMCGLVAYDGCTLTWWPFVRDMTSYGVSVIVLAIVMADALVMWQEAAIMVVVYCIYIVVLWQNERIEKRVYLFVNDTKSHEVRFEDAIMKKSLMLGDYGERTIVTDREEKDDVSEISVDDYCGYPTEPPHQLFAYPESNMIQIISWIITLPIKVILFLTIPDLRRPKCQKLVSVTFLLGITWIGVLTYILLWMVMVIGHTLGMRDSIIGLTFVTFVTSVPGLLCSVMVMRKDMADMAISQIISSNTLGILIGLGLPWLIKGTAYVKHIHIKRDSILVSCAIAFVFIAAILSLFYARRFVLDKKLGLVLVVGYALYLVGIIISEASLGEPSCKH